MLRSLGIVTALGLLAAACVTAASSVEAKQSSYVAGEQRTNVAAKKSVKRKAAKRKAGKRKGGKRKPAVAAKPLPDITPRTPANKNDCIEAAQAFYAHAQAQFRQKKQTIPREFERVVSKLNESCGEEDFDKARVSLDWLYACLKSSAKDACTRDKDYFCAIDPQSEACSTRKGDAEKKDSNTR
jgi:hypothetical protein